ncbi:hypothetical protein BDB01DRAFT_896325 [Pilobolus umbonatus]|nr:hypothetical protein BDB01DRAFT_896325 [Pilobolus umbonatus]
MRSMVNQLEITLNGDEMTNDSSSDGSRRYNQNTFSWSSTSSTYSALSAITLEEPVMNYSLLLLDDFFLLDRDKKQIRLCQILSRSASIGDIETMRQVVLDERLHLFLNINIADEDGSTPLIYASCFGKLNVVKFLLEMDAKVDIQDKIGWTALMWATTNGHDQIVELLLAYAASSDTKSASGRTIYDLVDTDNEKLIAILSYNAMDPTLQQRCSSSNWRKSALSSDDIHPYSTSYTKEDSSDNEMEDLKSCEASFRSVHKFVWDQCLPDQMFVFAEEEIDHILNVAIIHFKLPIKTKSEIYVPANIIFLCSRYAHYYTTRELVHVLLSKSVQRINETIKSHTNDIHTLAFWIANLSQLLYYLKKDAGLVVATADYQLNISELISESYTWLINDSEKRLDRIIESAMLEYEQLGGLETINFADDWQRFFRRSRFSISNNRKSINQPNVQTESIQLMPRALTPQLIGSLLTSTLYVLQSYEVHPVIIIQAMAQIFHFLSCELFNRILSNKKYLCRSKALQIRMNLTVIEEWVRENCLPLNLTNYFYPVIQLLQLLQCVSQLSDLMEFVGSTKNFDLLNPMQVKRVVLNYRYEVTEPRLPEEIEKYTMQIAEDTLKSIQQQEKKKKSIDSFRSSNQGNNNQSRPNSISSLGSILLNTMSQTNKKNRLSANSIEEEGEVDSSSVVGDENEDEREWLAEKRDSRYMLPFSLPTTTNMVPPRWNRANNKKTMTQDDPDIMNLSDSIYMELKLKMEAEREKNTRERSVVPSIPEEWLERLDHHIDPILGIY